MRRLRHPRRESRKESLWPAILKSSGRSPYRKTIHRRFRDLRFGSFVRSCQPASRPYRETDIGSARAMLVEGGEKVASRMSYVFAKDDSINPPEDWRDFEPGRAPPGAKFLILERGAHLGFSVAPSFEEILTEFVSGKASP